MQSVLFDNTLFTVGVVPESPSQVEEATKVELLVALPISPDAFPLPSTPWRHHLILPLLGTQRLLRWDIAFYASAVSLSIGDRWQFSGTGDDPLQTSDSRTFP